MSKASDSNNGRGGLLSKVVKFVRNPSTDWADVDHPKRHSSTDAQSRQALKQMIERKRGNDFVRNREFDLLRKLRRKGAFQAGGEIRPVSTSAYPNSQIVNFDERAGTLKKIDEIEAQMVTAWFPGDMAQTQPQEAPGQQGASDELDAPASAPAPTEVPSDMPLKPVNVKSFVPTEPMGHGALAAEATAPHAPSAQAASDFAAFGDLADLQAEDLIGAKLDPVIEEASIRFANGDAAGAEASLKELLSEGGSCQDDVETWLTLFDFYRATGEQAKFDDAAWHFAAHFGRSAPQRTIYGWDATTPVLLAQADAVSAGRYDWVCPSVLGVSSLTALSTALARHAPPWLIDWRYVKSIELAALPALNEVFQRWANAPVWLKFLGVERLLEVLAQHSPADDRQVDPAWWYARLALLRVLGDMEEFDLVALSYCVTYEVSPPAWEDPRNSFSPMTEDGKTINSPLEQHKPPPTRAAPVFQMTTSMGEAVPASEDSVLRAELEGELLGSAQAALQQLPAMTDGKPIEFNCRNLLRVDFGAAGDLLNWSMEQKREGRQVSFKQTNRMVAAFFGVIGIADTARVELRKD